MRALRLLLAGNDGHGLGRAVAVRRCGGFWVCPEGRTMGSVDELDVRNGGKRFEGG